MTIICRDDYEELDTTEETTYTTLNNVLPNEDRCASPEVAGLPRPGCSTNSKPTTKSIAMIDPPVASTSSAFTQQGPLSPASLASASDAPTSAAHPISLSTSTAALALNGPSNSRVEATPLPSQRPRHQSTPLQATAVEPVDADIANINENAQVKTILL